MMAAVVATGTGPPGGVDTDVLSLTPVTLPMGTPFSNAAAVMRRLPGGDHPELLPAHVTSKIPIGSGESRVTSPPGVTDRYGVQPPLCGGVAAWAGVPTAAAALAAIASAVAAATSSRWHRRDRGIRP